MHLVGLIGSGIDASLSPALHEAEAAAQGIDYSYRLLDIERLGAGVGELVGRARRAGYSGLNVTHPCKQDVVEHLDELAPEAAALDAVNTVVFRDGRAIGHNTDGFGAVDALREGGVRLPAARTLLLGAGGAARGIAAALRDAGADVTVAARTPARAKELGYPTVPWERLPEVMRAVDLLVNATTLGMQGERVPAPLAGMMPGSTVFDAVYGETPLVREARERGLRIVKGEAMLLHQGARSFTLWTGKPAPVAAMRAALEASP